MKAGADVNVHNKVKAEQIINSYVAIVYIILIQSGFTPLHYAAQKGHVLLVDTLIRLGAKPDGVNKVNYNIIMNITL